MEGDDFEAALAALSEGYSEGIYEGRRYGVNDNLPSRACKTYAAMDDRMAKSKRVESPSVES